jgi:hypothetical protein
MPLEPGVLTDKGAFKSDDCMAKFIEDALPSKPELGQRDRREFLIALSKGIIDYLKKHTQDFEITLDATTGKHVLVIK